MDGQSQDARGRGKNKRKWKHNEDVKLVQALLDMANVGTYKADNGFKPGYLAYIEEKLKVSLPDSKFQAKPHIESRIKTLRKDFTIVYDMMNGLNTSGFGYDEVKKCITAETTVWDAYIQSHPTHSTWRNKPFPFYDELLVIFGKDRATGSNAEAPTDMMEDIHREENINIVEENIGDTIEDLDASFSISPLQSPRNEEIHHQRKKRRTSYDSQSMRTDIMEASSTIASEIGKVSQILSKVFGVDAEISENRKKIHSEIKKIPNLTVAEIIKVVSHIASRTELIEVFFSMDDQTREQLARAIFNGEI